MSLPPSNVNQCVTDLIPYQAIGIGREGPAFICCRSFAEADATDLKNIIICIDAQLLWTVDLIVDHFLDQPDILFYFLLLFCCQGHDASAPPFCV